MSARRDQNGRRRILVLQHAEPENLGTIANALRSKAMEFEYVRAFDGEPIPERSGAYSGLVVMGGPMGVYETNVYPFLRDEMKLIESFLKARMPILGVCLGSQLLAASLGAAVRKGKQKEIGWHPVRLTEDGARDPLWRDQPPSFVAFHWHGDVFDLPKEAVSLASSQITPVQAFRYGERVYGLLCHLEVTEGQIRAMLDTFADEIRQEKVSAGEILKGAVDHLPLLQKIGDTVFPKWAESID